MGLPMAVAFGAPLAALEDGRVIVLDADRGLIDPDADGDAQAEVRDTIARRVSTLEFFFLTLNSETTGAILDLLDDRASMGAPLERLVFVWCLCESSLDREALKERLENVVDLVIR